MTIAAQSDASFACPHCGFRDSVFHPICPECGRPFQRDYVDVRMHPRDPDLTGVMTSRFWARVFLVAVAIWMAIMLCMWVYHYF